MDKKKLDKKIVITGGGSGGHVSVASAIIDSLAQRYSNLDTNLLYIGGDLAMEGEKRGLSLEAKMMEEKGIKFQAIRAGKLQRSFSFSTIPLFLRTLLGIIDSSRILRKYKPDLIISTGGFVSVPVALIAYMRKIPIYLHEQTAAVGLSNKIVGKVAKRIFTTFPGSLEYFDKDRVIHVGNAVRESIFKKEGEGELSEALDQMIKRREKYPILYISGGGQGSHVINITVRQTLNYILHGFQIVLQTGDNKVHMDYDVLYRDWKGLPEQLRDRLFVTKFVGENEIGKLFSSTDLFVGRAGANTVYELGALGVPAIFIPIPWVTHDEQNRNAKILVELGQARILPEGELTPEKLSLVIEKYWQKVSKGLKVDKGKAKEIFKLDAVEKIINNIL